MDIKKQLIDVSTPHINDEVCGFVCRGDGGYFYLEAKNRSPEPDQFFYISSVDFLKAKRDNNLVAIFHNHTNESEEPSHFDKVVSENVCFPMVIYSNMTKAFNIFVPEELDCDPKDIEKLRSELND
jgi:proteasome lid subunit RPN8/RPN11